MSSQSGPTDPSHAPDRDASSTPGSTSGPLAVIFDFGGVLTVPVSHTVSAWLRSEDIEPSLFYDVMRAWMGRRSDASSPVAQLETGELPESAFEQQLAAQLQRRGGGPIRPAGLLDRLFANLALDSSMVELARALPAAGCQAALLSNSWGDRYPRELLEELFSTAIVSERVGLRKPDPEIYRLTLRRLGVRAQQAVFIDDTQHNVVAATGLGITGIHHTEPSSTIDQLHHLIPDLAAARAATQEQR